MVAKNIYFPIIMNMQICSTIASARYGSDDIFASEAAKTAN